ncbi:hypothetical protein FNV43_RR16237 [Rhamnella rubrinervis]|uniref:Fe2OG dioxygenase domain-containing protein n=1 Tax=Rhamnella rubrinervis TaxID=2594499 RepID=A0A8K0E902_9ROSA|nr:hypothetical protein FNV43_RR16237 [Rhamnella rubrinervis]
MASMEKTKPLYARSLLVPSVQGLAKDPNFTIPSRYIRTDQDQPLLSDNDHALCFPHQIPVIDFQKLLADESNGSDSELEKFHLACKDWGFFQLVNHGVSSSFLEKAKTEFQNIFKLPFEEKKKLWQTPEELEGFGQIFVVSEEQKLDWSDLFMLTTLPIHARKPLLFTKLSSTSRETLETYSMELQGLELSIMSQIEKALKLKDKEEKVIGLNPHSNVGGLTILLQVNGIEGLQVKKTGEWVTVKPLPNAFIVNIGDVLEMVTNCEYRSIEHRAIINSQKERVSFATFNNPRFGVEISPARSLITKQSPAKYKTMGFEKFLRGYFARELDSKSCVDSMKL